MVRYWMAGVVALALAGCQASGPVAPKAVSRSEGAGHPLQGCTLSAPAVQAWDFEQAPPVAADLDGDRAAELLVVAGADGGALSVYRARGGALAEAGSYPLPAGSQAAALAAGDVDRDGRPDAVALVHWYDPSRSQPYSFAVATYLNDGRGGLRAPLLSGPFDGVVQGPARLADLDGDGSLDLLATTDLQKGLYGDGRGGFALRPPEVRGGGVEVGDFNEDGRPDLLTLGCGSQCVLALLPGQPGGGFGGAVASALGGTWSNGPLAAGDLDGDGHRDAVFWGEHGLTALFGDGRGGLGGALEFGTGDYDVGETRLGDVDGDGRLDVLQIRQNGPLVRTFLNQGGRSFREGPSFFGPLAQTRWGGGEVTVLAADLDGDGRTDLAFDGAGGVELAFADGLGGFGPDVSAPFQGGWLFGADFRGDGTTQLVTGWPQALLALGADGGLQPAGQVEPTWPDGGYNLVLEPVAAVDFDRDGHLDLVGFAKRTDRIEAVEVLRGDGRGNLGYLARSGLTVSPYTGARLAVGDLNRDGYPDVVASNDESCDVQVLLNDFGGGFAPPVAYPAGACWYGSARRGGLGPAAVAVGDFDGDQLPDVAVLNTQEHALYLYPGDGRGGLGASRTRPQAGAELASGDLDGDGIADLVVFDPLGGERMLVALRGARGGWGAESALPGPAADLWPTRLWVRDLDGDGDLDVALGGTLGTALLLGDGRGGFAPALESPIPSQGGLAVGALLPGSRPELLLAAGLPATRVSIDCH